MSSIESSFRKERILSFINTRTMSVAVMSICIYALIRDYFKEDLLTNRQKTPYMV